MDGFSEFYAAGKDTVFRTVLAASGDRQLAEDAVAEAFARACVRWHRVREHPNPIAWVIRVALNVQRSWWRRVRREVPGSPEHVDTVSAPDGLAADLRAALATLPRRQREVVALRVIADLSAGETAALLDISTGTVGSHLHRALATLRSALSPSELAPVEEKR